jgi:hypothetical protein
MDFLTNETQINSATAIITSLNKEESKKVYDYLVSVGLKNNWCDFRFRKFVKSIPKDDAKYAAIVAGLPIDNALKYESWIDFSNTKFLCGFSLLR